MVSTTAEGERSAPGRISTRRTFLKASSLLAWLLTMPFSKAAAFMEGFPVRTVERDTFQFDPSAGKIRWSGGMQDEAYRLVIDGLVEKQLIMAYQDLKRLSQVTQVSDLHCVEGWSVSDIRWGGFRFEELLKRVTRKPGADYAVFHAIGQTASRPAGQGHYVESFPVSDLVDARQQCLLALSMDGEPLPHDHGAPLRVVAPFSLGYKNIKYVRRVEFAEKPQPGWWTLANPIYPVHAPVSKDRLRQK